MSPLGWLLGLFLPACGATGAQGLPEPPRMDMMHIVRPSSPNTALAAPQGYAPPPDVVTPRFEVPPAKLFAAVLTMASGQPRTFAAADYADTGQAHFVVRSAVFNFPDLVTVQVNPAGADASTLVLYSRSVYGHSDLGANRARLDAWLAALQATLNPARER
jgi:uncharacterized protein (DUF1499 family)